jgi:hypothetical protein
VAGYRDTLERERISPVRFIKIDVQGYEPAVCQGMEGTLTANPDCVVSLEYMPEALARGEAGFAFWDSAGRCTWCSQHC